MTLTNVLGEQLLEAAKVFFAQVVPEISVFRRNEIIINKGRASESNCALSVVLLVEVLQLLHLVLQLGGHLVDLG